MIHPTAIISPKAEIGKNVEIGPYAVIEEDVKIGDDTYIDAHVKVCQYTTVGPRCRFYFGSLIGTEPQDHRFYKGIRSYCDIGSDTVIREYVTVHRPPFEDLKTVVGSHVLLMGFVHVAHDVIIADHATIANQTALSGHIQIGEGAVISGYTLVHQFCRIGSLAMIGAACKITQDIPPFCMLRDEYITGPNTIGLRRAGFSNERRLAIRKAIKTYFFDGLNSRNAIEQIEKSDFATPDVHLFTNFIKESKRGIMSGNPKYTGLSDEQRDALESASPQA